MELQIDAHIGGVNDIAFSHPNKTLSIITCGDDKLIKVRILCDLLFFSQNKQRTSWVYLDTGFGRCGMLKQDKSSTHLKAMKLLCILYALTTRSPFRYPWNDFSADILENYLFILLASSAIGVTMCYYAVFKYNMYRKIQSWIKHIEI